MLYEDLLYRNSRPASNGVQFVRFAPMALARDLRSKGELKEFPAVQPVRVREGGDQGIVPKPGQRHSQQEYGRVGKSRIRKLRHRGRHGFGLELGTTSQIEGNPRSGGLQGRFLSSTIISNKP